jgi:Spondin_N
MNFKLGKTQNPSFTKKKASAEMEDHSLIQRLASALIALLFTSLASSSEIRDQGQIFYTHDILQITKGTFSQTITAGVTGQLTRVQLQWNAEIPIPAPQLSLSIVSGGNPPNGDTLYSEMIDPTGAYSGGIFTWQLERANLFFEAGEQFTFNLSATGLGLVIAASDPPDYPGGKLYLDGELLPDSWVNDIAFITFVDPEASSEPIEYRVTIKNLTAGQTFSPPLLITHTVEFLLFNLANPASEGLTNLAEAGETEDLVNEVGSALVDTAIADAPLGPGQAVSLTISGHPNVDFITMAAMMLPTNDSFVALNRVKLPVRGWFYRMLQAYDAGTEENDQNCAHIPGAHCGGEGFSVESGEGFVHFSSGVHGAGGEDKDGFEILSEYEYDWRNPVAKITVQRVN